MALLLALSLSTATNVFAQTTDQSGGIEYRDEDGNLVERESEEVDQNELARVGIQAISNVEDADEEGEVQTSPNENAHQAIAPISADISEDTINPIWFVAGGILVLGGIGYFIKMNKSKKTI